MSHQGKPLTTDKGTVEQIYDRKIEQSGKFTAQTTAEEVAATLATDIAGKTGKLHNMSAVLARSGSIR